MRRVSSITRSISFPVELLDAVAEVDQDFAPNGRKSGGLSRFLRLAVEQYLMSKGARGRQSAKEQLGLQLLKSQVEADRLTEQAVRNRRERTERRLEEILEEEDERTAAGVASLQFESADALVAHYWGKLVAPQANEPAWRNLAQRHNLSAKEVLAVAARAPSQASLPRRRDAA